MSDPLLDARYAAPRALLSGTQALVRLPLEQRRADRAAGWNTAGFVTGYRGSPLAAYDRELQRAGAVLQAEGVVFQPGLNEDLAATAVWGTQQTGLFDGVRHEGVFGLWYGKGPGVDRSLDAIRHANAAGTNPKGGVLLLAGDDHEAASSTLPHQSEQNLISAQVPVLAPAGVAEILSLGLAGIAMSRATGLWVGLKCQTEIVESSAVVEVPAPRDWAPPEGPLPPDGLSLRWPDGPHAAERRLEAKLAAAQGFARANGLDRAEWAGWPARLGIVASGKGWLAVQDALAALGIDAARAQALGLRLYKVAMVWPLEPEGLRAFADGLAEVLVVEEKRPVIEDQLRALLYDLPDGARPRIAGKTAPGGGVLLSATEGLTAEAVAAAIRARLEATGADVAALPRPAAPPAPAPAALTREAYFCSGCPHSVSTRLPEGSRATTGIGCHMMVLGTDRGAATFTQMGGEGVSWLGLAPFTDERHIFVNMGDGTYNHSGILAIRAAIAAGVNATYKILYNDAVAMTGGQRHEGGLTVEAIVAQMLAEGARRVAVVAEKPEVWRGRLPAGVSLDGRDALDRVQRELREVPGVTVLVYDQLCAAERRRRGKRAPKAAPPPVRAAINPSVCEGCGDCSVQSNCISIEPLETPLGLKRRINPSSCNTDLSCLKGFCPSFVTLEGARPRKPAAGRAWEGPLPDHDLPEPALPATGDGWRILLAGIGGTGVITVSAVLAQAAALDGLEVLSLDHTGLSQKNGAVLSHLQLASRPGRLHAPRIGAGAADAVLGFDMVVAASAAARRVCAAGRTRVVVDDHLAPTASFVRAATAPLPAAAVRAQIERAAGDGQVEAVAAARLATALFGDAIAANMFLLGLAWQRGLVPVSRAAIDRAIGLNGAGVAMNRAAFALGRVQAADSARVAAMAGAAPPERPETPEAAFARRRAFLAAYHDAAYAARYATVVEAARAAEARATGAPGAFAAAVAEQAFRVMAIKDEYEVARLHRDPAFRAGLEALYEPGFRLSYHLAPPVLSRPDPRTGRPAKRRFGPWIEPLFAVLARARRLRGSVLDPFGHSAERRAERRLREAYLARVARLCEGLTPATLGPATEIAALPALVRGYGPVKAEGMAAHDARLAELEAALAEAAQPARARRTA